MLGALVAQVGLRGAHVAPIRRDFEPAGVGRDEVAADVALPGLGEQLLDGPFRLLVRTLAVVVVADAPLGVGEVEGGPVVVHERIPDRIVVVDRDRVGHPHVREGAADVGEVVLEGELGGMHADDDQALIPVLLGPGAEIGEGAQPVDAGVGAEVDEDDMAAQIGGGEGRGVEPGGGAVEGWQRGFDGQVGPQLPPIGMGMSRLAQEIRDVHGNLLTRVIDGREDVTAGGTRQAAAKPRAPAVSSPRRLNLAG